MLVLWWIFILILSKWNIVEHHCKFYSWSTSIHLMISFTIFPYFGVGGWGNGIQGYTIHTDAGRRIFNLDWCVCMLCYALLPLLLTPTSQMILPVVDNLFTVNHAIDYLRQGNYVFDSLFVCWQHQWTSCAHIAMKRFWRVWGNEWSKWLDFSSWLIRITMLTHQIRNPGNVGLMSFLAEVCVLFKYTIPSIFIHIRSIQYCKSLIFSEFSVFDL